MIASSRLRRRDAEVVRPQIALELALTLLAVAAGLVWLRVLLRLFDVGTGVWSGAAASALSGPLVAPLGLLPGGSGVLAGSATLADVTTAVLLLAVPLFVLSRSARP